jgi:hypothetical protein
LPLARQNARAVGAICGVTSGHEEWNVEWIEKSEFFADDFFVVTYAMPGHFGDEFGTSSITPTSAVPEPDLLIFFGSAMAALALVRRRRSF